MTEWVEFSFEDGKLEGPVWCTSLNKTRDSLELERSVKNRKLRVMVYTLCILYENRRQQLRLLREDICP